MKEYPYVDENGEVLFVQERRIPKDFRVKRQVGSGWAYSLGDVRRVLYRLPEVLAAVRSGQTVYVTEGERDADALAALGLTATTSPLGAGKWRPDYGDTLAGADVVVIADKDDAGRRHAADIVTDLAGKSASVRVMEAAVGKDVSDHLAAGRGVDDLQAVDLEEAAPVTPEESPNAGGEEDSDQRMSQASRLVALALARFRLLLGDDGRLYGVTSDGPNVALPLRGRAVDVVAPVWLSAAAVKVWAQYAPDLIVQGVLTSWDVEAFACWCDASARRRRAVAHLAADGEVIEVPVFNGHGQPTGHRLAKNPWLLVLNEADAQVQRYGARFGMTPADRAQIKVGGSSSDPNADLLSSS